MSIVLSDRKICPSLHDFNSQFLFEDCTEKRKWENIHCIWVPFLLTISWQLQSHTRLHWAQHVLDEWNFWTWRLNNEMAKGNFIHGCKVLFSWKFCGSGDWWAYSGLNFGNGKRYIDGRGALVSWNIIWYGRRRSHRKRRKYTSLQKWQASK